MNQSDIANVVEQVTDKLNQKGLASRSYTIPNYEGYKDVTQNPSNTIYVIESELGSSASPNRTTYSIVQLIDNEQPNLSVMFTIDRDNQTQEPNTDDTIFTPQIEKNFSYTLMPIIESAFNVLDPSGNNKSQLVQIYHAEVAIANLLPAIIASLYLTLTFKRKGQLAQIAVDFSKPFIVRIAKFFTIARRQDIFYLPATSEVSSLKIPLGNPDGNQIIMLDSTTSLDEGLQVAYQYLDKNNKQSLRS